MTSEIVFAKYTQNYFWTFPLKKVKHRPKKVPEQEFEHYSTLARELIKNKKQTHG